MNTKFQHLSSPEQSDVLTVTQLNRQARLLLETEFPTVVVSGELSNLARPSSGHWYFTLKDEQAQIRCAMFRHRNQMLGFQPSDGLQVFARGKISLYEGRGDFQLIVDSMEAYGDGLLRQQYEKLKQTLLQRGWFAREHKQEIPQRPNCIGVITSKTGAAIKDILNVLKRRFPSIPVVIYPTMVQGEKAAPLIQQAIIKANQHAVCDVLLLARGGGSLEDLWCFNDEAVAQAIFESQIPIITGIGHEIDITIADLVADLRAPTPSVAAELATPDRLQLVAQVTQMKARLIQLITQQISFAKHHLKHLGKRLQSPSQRLTQLAQRLDNLELRLIKSWSVYLQTQQAKLSHLAHALNAVSPLATLDRGYAMVTDGEQKLIHQVKDCQINQLVYTKLSDGTLTCRIEQIDRDK